VLLLGTSGTCSATFAKMNNVSITLIAGRDFEGYINIPPSAAITTQFAKVLQSLTLSSSEFQVCRLNKSRATRQDVVRYPQCTQYRIFLSVQTKEKGRPQLNSYNSN
jgi:hypothetical protein